MADSWFYFMKIKKFHIVSDRMQTLQNKYNRASISFVIGMKESTTNIKLEDSRFREETMARQFEEETHIIKCDAEETMIIRCRLAGTLFKASDILPLDLLKLRKGPDKNDKKTTSAEQNQDETKRFVRKGIAKVLLSPLTQQPHTKHKIRAHLNLETELGQLNGTSEMCVLDFELYLMMNFRANIEVIPVSAILQHNVAQIGEMKTVLVLSIEGQTWQSSEVDNGITPKWKGFFADESQCTTVENEKVETNLLTQYDQCMFFLRSAGSLLDVCIYSNGIFMSMEPVGSVELHIQNEGYFNRPRKMGDRTFETRQVRLYYTNEIGQVSYAGSLKLKSRFIIDEQCLPMSSPLLLAAE